MTKTKHLIKNYDQVKLRLADLTKQHHRTTRDYYFAVGDLFNQNIPAAVSSADFVGTGGLGASRYQQMLHAEITSLLAETESDISLPYLKHIRDTARSWKKSERIYDVAFSVYKALNAHHDLIRDGMTYREATEAVAVARGQAVSEVVLNRRLAQSSRDIRRSNTRHSYNPVQRLRVTANQLDGQLKTLAEDHSDLLSDVEEREIVREMYETLDRFVEQHGITPVELWEDA